MLEIWPPLPYVMESDIYNHAIVFTKHVSICLQIIRSFKNGRLIFGGMTKICLSCGLDQNVSSKEELKLFIIIITNTNKTKKSQTSDKSSKGISSKENI